ncbi:hypothetical protein PMAYCL1PPCAC_08123, partial [Pristionchus mayeri]
VMPHYRLTYFDLRARGEPIRMMFAIAGVPYEDERIHIDDFAGLVKDLPFGCLPVLEVDGVKVAQTIAILRYIARETGFAGPDNLTAAIADSLADQYADFVMAFMPWQMVNAGYVPGDKDALYESVYVPAKAKHFPYFEAAIKKSTTGWYANTPELTHADVFIAASLEWLKRMDKNADTLFDGFPLMEAQYKKVTIASSATSIMPHYKLTYFELRARGEPIRMMFAIAGIPYEDQRIKLEDYPDFKKETPFGCLPMLEVDGVKFAQTLAILRYVARENGYGGPDNLSAAIADALADQYADFVTSLQNWLVVTAGYVEADEFQDALYQSLYAPTKAKNFPFFEAALKKSTTGWYANTPELTHVDVFLAASLEWLTRLDKNGDKLFEGYPLMEAHYKKFFALPAIQKHVAERPDASAEPIRMMFSVAGVPYEDHRFTKAEWPELKKNFPFEAVPVLEVDGVQVAQTLAILRYVARENGFAGPDNLTAAIADSLADQFVDFLTSTEKWLISCFNDGPPKGDEEEIYKTVYVPAREKHFAYFEEALKKSTTGWYAGTPEPTHADFLIAEFLEFVGKLDKNAEKLFDGFPLMEAQYKKIKNKVN